MDQELLVNDGVSDLEKVLKQWGKSRSFELVGAILLQRLDGANVPITDAFWASIEENEPLQLYLATPLRDQEGLRKAAGKIREVLHSIAEEERGGLSLGEIAIVSPASDEVLQMRRRHGPVEYGNGFRTRRVGASVDEPFIYRLDQKAQVSGSAR